MTGLKVGDKVIHIGSGEEGTITGFLEHPFVRFGKRHVYVDVNKVQLAPPPPPVPVPWWKETNRKLSTDLSTGIYVTGQKFRLTRRGLSL